MESKNSTSGSTEELMEPLIGKEENSERPQVRSSRGRRTDYVPHPVAHPKGFEMKKNKSISIDSIEERKELIIDVDENLEPQAECCIYRVPRALRKKNEEAYTPKVISIGPLHHGKDEFADMEKQKIRYKRDFGERIGPEKWQQLINFIEENEKRIRNSYEEKSKLERLEFITMILYDAVFIIELFLRCYRDVRNDFLLDRTCLTDTISLDLRLLENQLPFFVLDGLYKSAFPNLDPENGYPSFISLSCVFFSHCGCDDEIPVKAEGILHFTRLSRQFMTMRYPKSRGKLRDLPCEVKLQGSGVKFNGVEGECLLDMRFEKKKLLGFSCFNVAELRIPHIDVDDYTESLMRTVMAFEQCRYPDETVVCNYIDLMDTLIDTDDDVNLLADARIISNYLGESARVAKMFNDLCLEISLSDTNYTGIIKDLTGHYDNPWNNAKATLKTVYFSNLWKGSGTVAAFLLLVFNLIQAMRTIISAFE